MAAPVSEGSLWTRVPGAHPSTKRPRFCSLCGRLAEQGWVCLAGQEQGQFRCRKCWSKPPEEKEQENDELTF